VNYYISDPHFGHANIIKFCSRPFKNVEEMNEALVENWNSVVKHDDTVYCMGDFGRPPAKFAHRLNGHIILIMGNHDKETQCIGHFNEIVTYKQIEIDGKPVNLKHYPYKENTGKFDQKFINRALADDGNWLIHGHVHNSAPFRTGKSINVSVEHINYTPISEDEIIKIMNE